MRIHQDERTDTDKLLNNESVKSSGNKEHEDLSPEAIQMRQLQTSIDQSEEMKELGMYQNMVGDKDVSPKKGEMPRKKEEAFFAITDPVAENAVTLYGHDTVDFPTLGFTTMIDGHDGPDIDYGIADDTATPTRADVSDEGSNESWALEEGTHLIPDERVEDKPLHVVVSADIAADILAAEQEHVDDYQYAKTEILDKADAWLNENLGERIFGPVDSEEEAADEEEMDPLEVLVDDFLNEQLQAHLGLTRVGDFEWANIGSYYKKASNQTEKRDENDWHSFGNEDEELADRVVRTITTGNTEIGNHDSADVIDLTEVD